MIATKTLGDASRRAATRLADGNAKALFVANGMMRRGRAIPMKPTADEALADVPSVEHVIVHARVPDRLLLAGPRGPTGRVRTRRSHR